MGHKDNGAGAVIILLVGQGKMGEGVLKWRERSAME
jgi:hypothetical protein